MTINTACDENAYRELCANVAAVEARIAAACERAGRPRESVKLVAASKLNSAERVALARRAGITAFGENRVQELCEKREQNAYVGAEVHLIGHLQRNKVKYVAGQVALIESVDSPELLGAINACCEKNGTRQDVLIELNLWDEESKTGLRREMLEPLLEECGRFSSVTVKGLMGIPPKSEDPDKNRRYFAEMHHLFVDIQRKKYHNVTMAELSMGMSADYGDAILAGATIVRVGTAIFGARDYGTLGCLQESDQTLRG